MEINGFYKEVLESLNKYDVRYLLVGGLAVGFHGYARYTGDMDLWLDTTESNLAKVKKSLKKLNYLDEVINQVIHKRPLDHPTPIRLYEDNNFFKVDLMTMIYYEPLTFDNCFKRAIKHTIDDYTLPIIGLKDLIEIKSNVKRNEGNMKDLVDAQELRTILEKSKSIEIRKKPSTF